MIILDGGMGQELVKRAGKATDLWSMQALLDSPEMVRAVHDEYFLPVRRLPPPIPIRFCQTGWRAKAWPINSAR